MVCFRPDELARWSGGTWRNGMPGHMISGISKDTRTLRPGDLYVALRGDRFDGHAFIQQAFEKGAVGALVDSEVDASGHTALVVPDTLKGLQDLARGYRAQWAVEVVGITGSVGKTTVKEMCADVLSMAGETHRTSGNYNNHIGLPLTMLSMPPSARFGVFEIGMNHPGEIGYLSGLLQPKIGILTDICNAHRESFASLEAIAFEKIYLLESLPENGVAIIDRDSPWFGMVRERTKAELRTVSLGGAANVAGTKVSEGVMRVDGFDYAMPQPGEHTMRNALRAIALGLEVGLAPEAIAEGLMKFKAPPMRWQETQINGIQFINDAYNANPLSMRASLGTFAGQSGAGAKWAVVGGMRELGVVAEEEHSSLGVFLDGLALDGVITVGELAQGIACKRAVGFHRCADAAEAATILKENLSAGDRVLLKASRGEQLEKVLERFKEL